MWHDKSTGTDVLLKPYVHCFVGDIAGINEMIGHYNNNSANCLVLVKDCKCNQEEVLESSEVLKIQVVVLNPLLSFIEYSSLRRLLTTHQRLAPS
jgi:hypothetical protein